MLIIPDAVRTKFLNGDKQNALLIFDDAYLSGADGDIESSGLYVEEWQFPTDDRTYSASPSKTLGASLINEDHRLKSLAWGWCRCLIGTERASDTSAEIPSDCNAYIGDVSWSRYLRGEYFAKDSGLYWNTTLLRSGRFTSIVGIDDSLYAYGDDGAVKIDPSDQTITDIDVNTFMAWKLSTPHSAYIGMSNEARPSDAYAGAYRSCVWDSEGRVDWLYVSMGVFNVDAPSTKEGIVTFDGAMDAMYLFDVDASADIESFTYPITPYQIARKFCESVGVDYSLTTLPPELREYTESPFPNTNYTMRYVLSKVGEALCGRYGINRLGRLGYKYIGMYDSGSSTYTIEHTDDDRIAYDTKVFADYMVHGLKEVYVKPITGDAYTLSTEPPVTDGYDDTYTIYGNMFIDGTNLPDIESFKSDFNPYRPCSFDLITADPSIDVGDAALVSFTGDDGISRKIVCPITHRLLKWNGICSAHYDSFGNEKRSQPSEQEIMQYSIDQLSANSGTETDNNYTDEDKAAVEEFKSGRFDGDLLITRKSKTISTSSPATITASGTGTALLVLSGNATSSALWLLRVTGTPTCYVSKLVDNGSHTETHTSSTRTFVVTGGSTVIGFLIQLAGDWTME